MSEQTFSPQAIQRMLIARALKDPQFRDQLIANPRDAVASTGVELPADVRITVVEQEPNSLYLVLPARPAAVGDAGELSEQELEKVAGGYVEEDVPRYPL